MMMFTPFSPLEAIMNGPILDELRANAAPSSLRSIQAVSGGRV
jgi:hypothetical protein